MVSGGRRALSAAAATLQVTWLQVHASRDLPGSGEGKVERDVGDEPVGAEEVAGGGDPVSDTAPTAADTPALGMDPNAEVLVVVTTSGPPDESDAPQAAAGGVEEEAAAPESSPAEEPTLDADNTNGIVAEDMPAPTVQPDTTQPVATEPPVTKAPIEPETTQPVATEPPVTNAPTELETTQPVTTEPPVTNAPGEPETTQPAAIVEVTTKPSLRTQDPAVISEAVTNDAVDAHAPGYSDQGTNPLVLAALAGICCIFLLLWGRKRRSSTTTSVGASGSANSKGPKVAYTQVPDEQPFSHSQDDDDDEFCDDYEEDTFANDRDNWDEWEGNTTQTQVYQLNPFVAAVPCAPRPVSPRQNKLRGQPLPPPPPPSQQHAQLKEIAIASKGDLLPSSVESNSSSDSFEVVTDVPPTSSRGATAAAEKESESVDDLFSVRVAVELVAVVIFV
ncbi:unnamed protein product [Phytophthora fragariaefolia]|uniref:Unnamed protein product n=1 Tax=Phytophthora fragariaefolia TaxID=1490495 RepID=A0A9W7CZ30_9STRA|nr:unnamed protein product [Phytophthora fragariaefolia]